MSIKTRNRLFAILRLTLKLLIITTIVLLVWNHFGMNREFPVTANTDHPIKTNDDSEFGGKSIASFRTDQDSVFFNCQIDLKYTWRYCTLTLKLADAPKGIDFSDYESITINTSYKGPGPESLRLYLLNYEPAFSKPDRYESLKINAVEFDFPATGSMEILLESFEVPSWWRTEQKRPLSDAKRKLDKVVFVALATSEHVKEGLHQIELKSIKFHGKWISQYKLLMWILAAWFVFGVTSLILELLDYRANLLITKKRVAHLVTVLREKKSQALESPDPTAFITHAKIDDSEEIKNPSENEENLEEEQTSRPNYLKWISATVGNSLRVVMIDDIIYFQSAKKYTRVVLADSEVLINKSLKELLDELDPEQFWKLHRSIIINILEVANITPNISGELVVKLKSRREQLPVSDAFIKKFRQSR